MISRAARFKCDGNRKGAGDGIRTHDNDVGNVVLYQLSYTRTANHGVAAAGRRIPEL